jgi:NitT/TauT family transport system permease protein
MSAADPKVAAAPAAPAPRHNLGREIRAAFRPNCAVSRTSLQILIAAQVAIALLIWWRSPFEVIPRPDEVFRALGHLWMTEGLGQELWVSFLSNLQALAITSVIALGLSYVTVLPVWRPIVTAVSKGRFIGLTGLTFLFTLVFGGGHPLKISLLVFGMSVFFVTSMASVVAEIPREKFDYARSLRMSEWRAVWEVVVLGTADQAIEVLRQNAAMGWMMLTMVESIARSEGGIGAMLLNQNKHFHLAEVFAIQLLILAVGMIQDYGIGVFKRIACPYSMLTLERQ